MLRRQETVNVNVVREGMSWTRAGLWGMAFLFGAAMLGAFGAYGPETQPPPGGWLVAAIVWAPIIGFPFGLTVKLLWKIYRFIR